MNHASRNSTLSIPWRWRDTGDVLHWTRLDHRHQGTPPPAADPDDLCLRISAHQIC